MDEDQYGTINFVYSDCCKCGTPTRQDHVVWWFERKFCRECYDKLYDLVGNYIDKWCDE